MCKWMLCVALLTIGSMGHAQSDDPVRDPTTPLGRTETFIATGDSHNYQLDSVLISAQRKLAIINGNSVREGQQIPGSGGIKVLRILPQKVVLHQGTKTWTLELSPAVVHRR